MYYNYEPVWQELWKLKEQRRDGELDGDEAMYEIETLMDEVGQ